MNAIDSSARLQQYRSQSYNSFVAPIPHSSNTDNLQKSTTNSILPLNLKSNFTRRSSLKVKTVLTKLTRPKNMERSQSDQTVIKTNRLSLDINPIISVQGLLRRSTSNSYTPSSNLKGINSSNIIVQDVRSRRKKDELSRSNPVIVESNSSVSRVSFSGHSSSSDWLHQSTSSSALPPHYSLALNQLPVIPEPRRKRAESIKKWISSLKSTSGASKRDSDQDSHGGSSTSFEVVGRPVAIRSKSAPVAEVVIERGDELVNEEGTISNLSLSAQLRSIPFPPSTSTSPKSCSDPPFKSNISFSRKSSIDFTKVDLSLTPRIRSTSVASLLSLSRPPAPSTSNTTPTSSPSRILNLSQTHTSQRKDVLPLLPLRARAIQIANNSDSNPNSTSTSQDDRTMIQRPSPSSHLLDSPLFHPDESSYFSSRNSKNSMPSSPSLTNATSLAAYLSDGPRLTYKRDAGSEEISLPSSRSHSEAEPEDDDEDEDDELLVIKELGRKESNAEKDDRGDLNASEEAELEKRLWRSSNLNWKIRESSESSEEATEGLEAVVKVW